MFRGSKKVYILVTPAKNEQESLPSVADSVLKQTILPQLWILVDDGSADETPVIIRELTAKYPWIQIHPTTAKTTGHHFPLCVCMRTGF